VNNYFCDFSNSSGDTDKSSSPSESNFPSVTNGLKKFDETGTKRMFAASKFSKPVERILNSTSPPLNVEPMYSGIDLIMEQFYRSLPLKAKLSVSSRIYCPKTLQWRPLFHGFGSSLFSVE
jgi:hypothetical protein